MNFWIDDGLMERNENVVSFVKPYVWLHTNFKVNICLYLVIEKLIELKEQVDSFAIPNRSFILFYLFISMFFWCQIEVGFET